MTKVSLFSSLNLFQTLFHGFPFKLINRREYHYLVGTFGLAPGGFVFVGAIGWFACCASAARNNCPALGSPGCIAPVYIVDKRKK